LSEGRYRSDTSSRRAYAGDFLNHEYSAGKDCYDAQFEIVSELVAQWCERLMSISWFMRAMNGDITALTLVAI
jgi:hypothetical protein